MAIVAQQSHAEFFHEFDEIEDLNLRKATEDALQSGKLTPLIKEELKLLIQTRRLSIGQDELTVTFSPPNRHENIVDPEKLFKRRKQNREAAQRFRQRRKTRDGDVINELEREQKRNMELTFKVQQLTNLRNNMTHSLIKRMLQEERGFND